jgi:hypothetical protein
MIRKHSVFVGALVTAVMAVACGGGDSKSPASPSSTNSVTGLPPSSGAIVNGATISGTVLGGIGAASVRPASAAMTVSVAGTPMSSPIDASGSFMLRGVPTGHVQLQFSTGGGAAHLDLDDVAEHEDIHLTVTVNGANVEVEDNDRETEDNRAEVEGRVTNVDASARTLTVAGKVVSVPAGTPIQHGDTAIALADIHVGDRVHVHGVRSGATITASKVEVQNFASGAPPAAGPGDDHGNEGAEAELHGAVAAKSGGCPSITFTIGATKVSTNASTAFEDTTCAALANGDRVEVKGTRQADSSVVATRVEKDK